MKELINRPQYIEQLIQNKDVDLVKIVTGIRRCGKSSILDLYHQYLSENGVDELAQVMIRFENGMRATFNAGMNLGTDTSHRYDRFFIHGSRGNICSDVEYNQSGEIEYTVMSDWKKTVKKVKVSNNYTLEVQNLSRAARHTLSLTSCRMSRVGKKQSSHSDWIMMLIFISQVLTLICFRLNFQRFFRADMLRSKSFRFPSRSF